MFTGSRRAAAALARNLLSGSRPASSLPEAAAAAPTRECADVAAGLPLLLKLPERAWGARQEVSTADVSGITGGALPERIALARHAFAPHDHSIQPLASIIQPLRPGQVAVHSSVGEPHERVLVDEYVREGGAYRLQRGSTDLLRWLRGHGVRACFVPDPQAAAGFNSHTGASRCLTQSTNEVLMVAPTAFTFNDQAAQDNSFMHSGSGGGGPAGGVTAQVLREFAGLHHALTEEAGVRVTLFEHGPHHGTPDAVFPNNWFSTHAAGEGGGAGRSLVLYPMKCPNRQAERRSDILQVLRGRGYAVELDLSGHEREAGGGRFFEGTGVLVLDRINGVAYCAISERAHADVAERWVEALGYRDLVTFTSTDARGSVVYHTNVMMAIGTDVAVVCGESVADDAERRRLFQQLGKRHAVVDISRAQMDALCGNVLELEDGRGLPVMAMSTRAYNAFTPDQRAVLRRHCAKLVHAPIDTLEYIGGGGVRCTLAELF